MSDSVMSNNIRLFVMEESRKEQRVEMLLLKKMSRGSNKIKNVSNLMRVKEHKMQRCIIDVKSCELIMKLESIKVMKIASLSVISK